MGAKEIISDLLPWVGAALGGPAAIGAKVIDFIADKAGVDDPSIDGISKWLQGATPEDLLKAEQWRGEWESKLYTSILTSLDEQDKRSIEDTASARKRQEALGDSTPQILLWFLLILYLIEFLIFWFGKAPTDEFVKTLLIKAFGITESGLLLAFGYFLGSSRSSKTKDDVIGNMMNKLSPKEGK